MGPGSQAPDPCACLIDFEKRRVQFGRWAMRWPRPPNTAFFSWAACLKRVVPGVQFGHRMRLFADTRPMVAVRGGAGGIVQALRGEGCELIYEIIIVVINKI